MLDAWQMEAADDAGLREARDTQVVYRPVGDLRSSNSDASWNVTFGVNNHLVLLTATALFLIYLVASLMLFVWRWRGCLVRYLLDHSYNSCTTYDAVHHEWI